jgi:hypothetical protein
MAPIVIESMPASAQLSDVTRRAFQDLIATLAARLIEKNAPISRATQLTPCVEQRGRRAHPQPRAAQPRAVRHGHHPTGRNRRHRDGRLHLMTPERAPSHDHDHSR